MFLGESERFGSAEQEEFCQCALSGDDCGAHNFFQRVS